MLIGSNQDHGVDHCNAEKWKEGTVSWSFQWAKFCLDNSDSIQELGDGASFPIHKSSWPQTTEILTVRKTITGKLSVAHAPLREGGDRIAGAGTDVARCIMPTLRFQVLTEANHGRPSSLRMRKPVLGR